MVTGAAFRQVRQPSSRVPCRRARPFLPSVYFFLFSALFFISKPPTLDSSLTFSLSSRVLLTRNIDQPDGSNHPRNGGIPHHADQGEELSRDSDPSIGQA